MGKGVSQLKQMKESLKERVKPSQRAKIQKQHHRNPQDAPTNPYELKFAKTKHEVLNRKVKGVKGKPGVARKRATEHRDLLPEMRDKLSGKTGVFEDKRIGERNPNMSIEDKMFDRFVQEQKRKQKGSLFNLEDDTLTHMGQSLSTIDDFDMNNSDLEEDTAHGGIEFSTVRHDHFGNFDDPSPQTDSNTHANGDKKTKAEVMKEVIAKSKHFKEVRRVQREEDFEGGEALDEEFEEMRELLMLGQAKDGEGKEYDMFVREMASDKRAAPSDRLKTDQEVAMEAKSKLEVQERERLARMNGTAGTGAVNDRQAQGDDLNEFVYAPEGRTIVEYNRDGELVAVQGDEIVLNEQGEMQESESDESESDDQAENEEQATGEEVSEYESANEGMDSELLQDETMYLSGSEHASQSDAEIKESAVTETIAKELPFIFIAPQTQSDLRAYTDNTTPQELNTIISRIRVLHSVNLGGENRQKLLTLFTLLYQEYEECTSAPRLETLQRHIHALSLQFASAATGHAIARLESMQAKFKASPVFSSTSDLLYLNLIGVVFSVSDARHSVCVPATTFMCGMLGLCGVKSEVEVVKGLWICREIMRGGQESGKYAPEVWNFLYRCVRLLQGWTGDCLYPVHPADMSMAVDEHAYSSDPLALCDTLFTPVTIKTRSGLLVATYRMLFKYAGAMQALPAFVEAFGPLEGFLGEANVGLGSVLEDESKVFRCLMAKARLLRRPLKMQARKPVPIASYLPKFDEKFSLDRKSADPNSARAQNQKLAHEHKREFKGAVRELKRDADFIATEKLRVIKEKDGEYKKKIRGIMGQLETQEGAMRGYEREKKRGKR